MKRTYKTLESLAKNTNSDLTLEDIKHKRAYFNTGKNKGYCPFNLKMDDSHYEQIADLLGGNVKTKTKIIWTLKNRQFDHWGLGRIIYSSKRKIWTYCAGQDYPSEITQVRNFIKNY